MGAFIIKMEKENKEFMETECESCHSIWSFEELECEMIRANLIQCPLCWKKDE